MTNRPRRSRQARNAKPRAFKGPRIRSIKRLSRRQNGLDSNYGRAKLDLLESSLAKLQGMGS